MQNPIPLTVLVNPPRKGMEWVASVSVALPGYGSGTACGETVGQAIQDALIIALTTGPEHTPALVS